MQMLKDVEPAVDDGRDLELSRVPYPLRSPDGQEALSPDAPDE